MAQFLIRDVEAFSGNQIILWLDDEATGADGPGDGTQYCVRLTVDKARSVIPALFDAYAATMQNIATELACGGCRTCRDRRTVNGQPCPVCVPRGRRRLRDKVMLTPDQPRRQAP